MRLHNNPAEVEARFRVRKRDISFGPRTEDASPFGPPSDYRFKKEYLMTIIELEKTVTQLSDQELSSFRAWFEEYDAHAWDQQAVMMATSPSGSMDRTTWMGRFLSSRATIPLESNISATVWFYQMVSDKSRSLPAQKFSFWKLTARGQWGELLPRISPNA